MNEWIKYEGVRPEKREGYSWIRWAAPEPDGGFAYVTMQPDRTPWEDATHYMYLRDAPELPEAVWVRRMDNGGYLYSIRGPFASGSIKYVPEDTVKERTARVKPLPYAYDTLLEEKCECGQPVSKSYVACPRCRARLIR